MSPKPQKLSDPETRELRLQGGKLIKELRERAGYSQIQFANAIGVTTKVFISQVETGRSRIPPAELPLWAKALRVEMRDLLKLVMRFYDPLTFALLFEDEAKDLHNALTAVMATQVIEPPKPKPEVVRATDVPAQIMVLQGQVDELTEQVRMLVGKVDALAEKSTRGPSRTAKK